MRPALAVYRFLYDFIVGDDWKIAAGVLVSLVVGAGLLWTSLPTNVVVTITAALLAAAFATSLIVDTRRRSGEAVRSPRARGGEHNEIADEVESGQP